MKYVVACGLEQLAEVCFECGEIDNAKIYSAIVKNICEKLNLKTTSVYLNNIFHMLIIEPKVSFELSNLICFV